jgi:hypothetical protein
MEAELRAVVPAGVYHMMYRASARYFSSQDRACVEPVIDTLQTRMVFLEELSALVKHKADHCSAYFRWHGPCIGGRASHFTSHDFMRKIFGSCRCNAGDGLDK